MMIAPIALASTPAVPAGVRHRSAPEILFEPSGLRSGGSIPKLKYQGLDVALRQTVHSEFYDDVVFILNRIHSLPPDGSEHVQPSPLPSPLRSVRVSKSNITQTHDLNVALPGPWPEQTGELIPVWHTPMHWRDVKAPPLEPISVISESTANAWE